MTNSDRLQEIRERADKATPGPWEYNGGRSIDTPPIHADEANYGVPDDGFEGGYQFYCSADDGAWRYADGEFIAASREDIPWLLQHITEQREVLDSAVRFIESALVICARSCNPGDGLHVSWGEDICKAARTLGPLNALEKLKQENEAKGYRKQERPM